MEIKDLEGEIWKDISEFEGYYMISDYGRVKSIARNIIVIVKHDIFKTETIRHIGERIKKPSITANGIKTLTLTKNGKIKSYAVKLLVAKHFIPNPFNCRYINNKDEDKLNCRADNLEWCTSMYYTYYGTRNGRKKRIWTAVTQMNLDGSFVAKYESISHACRTLASQGQSGFHISEISRCCNGHLQIHNGYKWKFTNDKKDENE